MLLFNNGADAPGCVDGRATGDGAAVDGIDCASAPYNVSWPLAGPACRRGADARSLLPCSSTWPRGLPMSNEPTALSFTLPVALCTPEDPARWRWRERRPLAGDVTCMRVALPDMGEVVTSSPWLPPDDDLRRIRRAGIMVDAGATGCRTEYQHGGC